ncbi:unnamed protein product [Callosobruchus maculatus]|uniref:Uncharacterized protein n=1 Tax=Callosobruchus maculatus TaxID=64391 RepID=A0A653CJF5_CALMS|nr:unnamed protein product [Callosobruchus maculatus]
MIHTVGDTREDRFGGERQFYVLSDQERRMTGLGDSRLYYNILILSAEIIGKLNSSLLDMRHLSIQRLLSSPEFLVQYLIRYLSIKE